MRLRKNHTLVLALLVALGTCYYYFDLLLPRARLQDAANEMVGAYDYGGDFYPIWLTGRELLFHGKNPYTQEMTREIQTGLFGRPMDPRRRADPPTDFRSFSYPLYVDLLVAPLLPVGFDTVRVVLGILLPLLTAASLIFWLRAFHLRVSSTTGAVAIILFLVSYPVLEGLYAQQAGLLVGAALALTAAMLARGRFWLAGMLLASASVKPQLVWLLALWLLLWAVSDWKRRKAFPLSFILCMGLLVLVSHNSPLPGWFVGWWRSLAGYSHYTLPPLSQLVLGRFLGAGVGLATLTLAAAACWRARREPAGSATFSLAMSFCPRRSTCWSWRRRAERFTTRSVSLPAILWLGLRRAEILNASRPLRVLALAAMIALCWQWITACGVAFASGFWPARASNPAVLVFPTRMAASLPFVLLALLSFFIVRILRRQTDTYGVLLPVQG